NAPAEPTAPELRIGRLTNTPSGRPHQLRNPCTTSSPGRHRPCPPANAAPPTRDNRMMAPATATRLLSEDPTTGATGSEHQLLHSAHAAHRDRQAEIRGHINRNGGATGKDDPRHPLRRRPNTAA